MKFLIRNRRCKKIIRIVLVPFRIQKEFQPTVLRSERIFQISPILHVLKQISEDGPTAQALYFNSAENFDRCGGGGSGGTGTAGLVGRHAGTD